jgi:hypothetical protein
VLELATSQPEKAVTDVTQLAERVRRAPASANVEVGRFVDERRKYFDYDDYFARARNADSSQ